MFLRVAGYHTGETKFIGERRNVLSIKVETIPESIQNTFLMLVRMLCQQSFAACRFRFCNCEARLKIQPKSITV